MTATAPKQARFIPTFTDRTAPAHLDLCNVCGEHTALTHPGEQTGMCPVCARRNVLRDAAQASLETLFAPILGAWVNHWQGAGLTFQDLVDVVELASGAWANDDHEGFLQRRALRYVRRAYPTPTVTHAKPDRMTFALEDLPMLEDVRPADSAHPWPYFEDGEGKKVDVLAGPDALILTLAGDVRAVLYTGIHGQTYHKARPEAPGFQVPPRLWPAVTAALSGPHGVLPSLTGVDVDAGGVTLTLDLYGKSSRYSLTARARYTAREPHALGLPYRVTFPEVLDRGREFFALALWVPADLWRAFRTALPHGVVRGPARPA